MKMNYLARMGVTEGDPYTYSGIPGSHYTYSTGELWECRYEPGKTSFRLWSPVAEKVRVNLYRSGHQGNVYKEIPLHPAGAGFWEGVVQEDLNGSFYTFQVYTEREWLAETPGLFALAVGVNGKRAAVIDWKTAQPEGWQQEGPPVPIPPADAVIYELHLRDFSTGPASGIRYRGKYLAFTQAGTRNREGKATGLDHLKELGITHLHLLPVFDFGSIDETDSRYRYNWGYDPQNYNVPEGSYATDAYDPVKRIREFKEMVMSLHRAGIRVVMDVVYNHTWQAAKSAFDRIYPGYFFRRESDRTYCNGSGCGNETASEKPMMRKFMVESICYWMKEYHIDGFRFDLMGLHDIDTMNEIAKAACSINPDVLIYGEGWSAGEPAYPRQKLAMKENISRIPGVAAFSDEFRDALRGPFYNNRKGGFLTGVSGYEESVKFGVTGAVSHPQIKQELVSHGGQFWASTADQMIAYASCHDDLCLGDRLKKVVPLLSEPHLIRLCKLAAIAVLTSQGIPFIYAGEEMLRDKQGVHNSYKSSDEINAIDWNRKSRYTTLFDYYRKLIALRKSHPAFRLGTAARIVRHLEFLPVNSRNVVAWWLKDHAGGDSWKDIIVVLNSNRQPVTVRVPWGKYRVVCKNGDVDLHGMETVIGKEITVPAQSGWIMYR